MEEAGGGDFKINITDILIQKIKINGEWKIRGKLLKMIPIERLGSGIPGLDEMLEGGFPIPSTILLSGEPGTGKTTLAVQSLFHGARQKEIGLYITAVSEPGWVIQKFLSQYDFYSQKLIESEVVQFLDIGRIKDGEKILAKLLGNIERFQPKRIVIDSINPIRSRLEDTGEYRELMYDLLSSLKGYGCVTILICEASYSDLPKLSEAYLSDGIIVLSYREMEGSRKKYLEVLKMRGTDHTTGMRSVNISKKGLLVYPELR
ncbi:MAG: KaiA-binding protein [Candidatus Altiarchaeales archaeon]|nr:MAG: KaiA-binding protein [Candidatus Altiarchaeales archaeon]